MNAGIYSVAHGPQLSDAEAATLESLPETAKQSRPATHRDLELAIVAVAQRHGFAFDLQVTDTGFTAVVEHDLRVVANKRGSGEETFYCQATNADLLRMLAEELARACGPQIVLPSGGDEGVLVIARN
jgi:hypothetical protein